MVFMAEVETLKEEKLPFKKIYAAYIIFLIAQLCLTVSVGAFGSRFKFLPRWLENFALFALLGYVLCFISTLMLKKYSKQFYYSFITAIILGVTSIVDDICMNSTDGLYLAWGKGLVWSIDFIEAVFFGYFFQGTYLLFSEYGHKQGAKKTKGYVISFAVLFSVKIIVTLFSKFPFIINNIVTNRVFVYSSWILDFVFYIYILVITIICFVYIHKINKKEGDSNEEVSEIH